jgi:hypothetical protein
MLLPFTAPKLHTITKDTYRYLFESWIYFHAENGRQSGWSKIVAPFSKFLNLGKSLDTSMLVPVCFCSEGGKMGSVQEPKRLFKSNGNEPLFWNASESISTSALEAGSEGIANTLPCPFSWLALIDGKSVRPGS